MRSFLSRLTAAAVTVALLASATTRAAVAPNPGNATVVTNSTTTSYLDVLTPVSVRVDQYSTEIKATLNGGPVVYDQTFNLPYNDPAVQAAVQQADAILTANNATSPVPALTSSSTVPQTSVTTHVVQPGPYVQTGNNTVSATSVFGPTTVFVGDNQTDTFDVLPGQLDINVNTNIEYYRPVNVVTTDTVLNSQAYTINGITSPAAGSVPLPRGAGPALLTFALLGVVHLRRTRATHAR